MKNYFFIFSISWLLFSCSFDYDPGQSDITEQNRLVVNGLLNPAQPVNVYFYKTGRIHAEYRFEAVSGVKAVLKENGKVLFDGICNDTVLQLDYPPKPGSYYSIEVALPGFETVSASTTIPDSITCKAGMIMDSPYNQSDWLVELSTFKLPADNQASLWITSYAIFKDETRQYQEMYANNLLIDKVNQISGMPVKNPVVGSLYYDAFLRIKNNNLPSLDKLVFTPNQTVRYDQTKFDPENPASFDPLYGQEQISIKLITASREYDQYCRTLYLQKSMIIYDDDISAILYQPIQVYSNVKNGMGIFAGLTETNYYFNLTDEETNPHSPAALDVAELNRSVDGRK